jgi:hypothetical protein
MTMVLQSTRCCARYGIRRAGVALGCWPRRFSPFCTLAVVAGRIAAVSTGY